MNPIHGVPAWPMACRYRGRHGRGRVAEDLARLPYARSRGLPLHYQESTARKIRDKASSILQARCVGDSTTINWTSNFRTPAPTLAHWRQHFGLDDFTEDELRPWFEHVEERFDITGWRGAANAAIHAGPHGSSGPGGWVQPRSDGTPVLDRALTDYPWQGVRRAWLAMAEMQSAASAREVVPVHEQAVPSRSWDEARTAIAALPLQPHLVRVVSAPVTGGCTMAGQPQRGVVDSFGRHFQLHNVVVADGSLFPTSIGANPQLSIYAVVAHNMHRLSSEPATRP